MDVAFEALVVLLPAYCYISFPRTQCITPTNRKRNIFLGIATLITDIFLILTLAEASIQ